MFILPIAGGQSSSLGKGIALIAASMVLTWIGRVLLGAKRSLVP